MNNEQAIITIEEFRSLTGFASAELSDEQVVEVIRQLDIMAQIYIKQVSKKSGKDKHGDD